MEEPEEMQAIAARADAPAVDGAEPRSSRSAEWRRALGAHWRAILGLYVAIVFVLAALMPPTTRSPRRSIGRPSG